MNKPLENQGFTPERIERLVQAARIERARAVRAGLASVFGRLRGLFGAKPERQPEACLARF